MEGGLARQRPIPPLRQLHRVRYNSGQENRLESGRVFGHYDLDEFTFRFNRRTSWSRGKLFYRLLQQAVAADPAPHKTMVEATWAGTPTPKM